MKLSIKMPAELVQKIDQQREEFYLSRTEFIRQAAVEKLQRHAAVPAEIDPRKFDITITDQQLKDFRHFLTAESIRRLGLKSAQRKRNQD